ncbi:vacuolar protein sorting-associated protein 2-like protein 3-like isoform X1 [Gossypium australe]|uniref:Vacuolar protein sorting-associated protein 2-like protein 3-like isoform X1 n=1 Tax=Gossypium australe TaxID=47621 RepID=A0A5B6UMW6_9ROSI|nr:vacuolar protein sorting-associated protein 2-like protein 3-like isoform X1 [Gossypium australe]
MREWVKERGKAKKLKNRRQAETAVADTKTVTTTVVAATPDINGDIGNIGKAAGALSMLVPLKALLVVWLLPPRSNGATIIGVTIAAIGVAAVSFLVINLNIHRPKNQWSGGLCRRKSKEKLADNGRATEPERTGEAAMEGKGSMRAEIN